MAVHHQHGALARGCKDGLHQGVVLKASDGTDRAAEVRLTSEVLELNGDGFEFFGGVHGLVQWISPSGFEATLAVGRSRKHGMSGPVWITLETQTPETARSARLKSNT